MYAPVGRKEDRKSESSITDKGKNVAVGSPVHSRKPIDQLYSQRKDALTGMNRQRYLY